MGPLMAVDPVLDRHPSPLIVVPLPHQGGVAGATGVGRARLVRGPAAEGRRQLQQEREVGQGPRSLHCNPMRAGGKLNVTITNGGQEGVTLCTVGSQQAPRCRRQSRQFWAGSRPSHASHRGTYSPKYHWLSQEGRARGRWVTEEAPWWSNRPASLLAAVERDNCRLLAITAKASVSPSKPTCNKSFWPSDRI